MMQRLKTRSIDDLVQMISYIADPENEVNNRTFMAIQAVNFLRPKNVDDRIKTFE